MFRDSSHGYNGIPCLLLIGLGPWISFLLQATTDPGAVALQAEDIAAAYIQCFECGEVRGISEIRLQFEEQACPPLVYTRVQKQLFAVATLCAPECEMAGKLLCIDLPSCMAQ